MNDIILPKRSMADVGDELQKKREALRRKLLNGDSILFEDESNKIEEERCRLTQELSPHFTNGEGATIDYNECYNILFNQIKIVIDGDSVPFHKQESITLLELNDKYDFSLSQVCGFINATIQTILYFSSEWLRFTINDNGLQIEPPSSNAYESVLSNMLGTRAWGDRIKLMIGDAIINTKDLGRYLLMNSTISIKGWNICFYFIIRHIREYLKCVVGNKFVIPNSGGGPGWGIGCL